jgi:transposase
MITLPLKTHIWIAAGVTDLRRGFDGLSALVQTKLEQSPFRVMCLCSVADVAI